MIWIFAAALVVLAVLSPGFRKFGLALAGVAVVGVVILIVINERSKPNPAPGAATAPAPPATTNRMMDHDQYVIETRDKDDPEAKKRIALAEVRFGQIQPVTGPQSGTIQSIQARLYNDSTRFTLTNFAYYLVVQDCIASKRQDVSSEQCTTVYDQRQLGIPIEVPPTQARDIAISISPSPAAAGAPFKLLGRPHIELTPTGVRAYRSPDRPQPDG